MKILIVRTFPDIMKIESYNAQEIGLAKALIRAGHECDIILYHGKNPDEVRNYTFWENEKSFQYKIFWCHGYNLLKNGYMPSVKKILKDYDVIQVDEYDLLYSWYLYTGQFKPTVIYHGLYHSEYTKGYNLKCFLFDRLFFRWKKRSGIYEQVVCLTKSELAAVFMKEKGFRKVYAAGVGLDADRFKIPDNRENPRNLKEHDHTLLYVGKIEERRNSLFLVDVLDELLQRGVDVQLKVIGTGEKKYVDRFIKKAQPFQESGNLVYREEITQEELPEEYAKADLFLFPSNYEIFGMVLLESMYFGLPVVSSYNGGSSVLIEESGDRQNGAIVRNFDTSEWVDMIVRLLNDKNCMKSISHNAMDTIRERFIWDKLVTRFVEAYREAIIIQRRE